MKTHKHAKLIKAWADGHTIEMLTGDNKTWEVVPHPSWLPLMEYRIKSEDKTKIFDLHFRCHLDGNGKITKVEVLND